jgi:hypothetical protein
MNPLCWNWSASPPFFILPPIQYLQLCFTGNSDRRKQGEGRITHLADVLTTEARPFGPESGAAWIRGFVWLEPTDVYSSEVAPGAIQSTATLSRVCGTGSVI